MYYSLSYYRKQRIEIKTFFFCEKKQCLVDDIFKSLRLWIFYVKDIWFVPKTVLEVYETKRK